MLSLFVVLLIGAELVLVSSARTMEDKEATAAARRMRDALDSDVRALDDMALAWGARFDTYAFMEMPTDTAELHADLTPEALAEMGVNFLFLCDLEGALVHAEFVDLDLGVAADPDQDLEDTITANDMLRLGGDPRASINGFVRLPGGIALVAARPITSGDLYAPPRGTLVLGRYVDDWELESLSSELRMPVVLGDVAQPPRPAKSQGATAAAVWWTVTGADTIAAATLISDLSGEPLATLKSELPRAVHAQTINYMWYTAGALILLGAAATLTVAWVVDRGVLSRVMRLSNQVNLVRDAGVATMRLDVDGNDELTDLMNRVNDMLASLEGFEQELAMINAELEDRVTERTNELAASEARFRGLLHRMADAVFSVDLDGCITMANARGVEMSETPLDELVGMRFSSFVGASMASEIEQRASGAPKANVVWTIDVPFGRPGCPSVPAELKGNACVDELGAVIGTQWIARDMTERKKLERQLMHMASHDHLTGLRNRRAFEQALELELAEVRRNGGEGAIVWMDLDDFKDVNDTLGHRAGDEVLIALGGQLRRHVRESNMLARLGGDEFAVLMPGVNEAEAIAGANRILSSINSYTHAIGAHTVRLSASAGVVAYPEHGLTVEELLANADLAMYQAKDSGRSRVHVHKLDNEWGKSIASRVAWNERITNALDNDRFFLCQQPVLDMRTGGVSRFELLIRLWGDDGQMIMPDEFLPTAERLGLVHEIDRWVASRAVRYIAEASDQTIGYDMNLSGKAFSDPVLLQAIGDAIREWGIDPARLGFEITETAAIADIARAQALISALKDMGCRFSLDDFGSGFSSFYYLKHLSIDCLKVDGGFIKGLAQSALDQHLVRGMVEMCRGLEIEVAAECVEDKETLDMLGEIGVDYAQGYFIGRPEPVVRDSVEE